MKELIASLNQEFRDRFGGLPRVYSQSPGRINIIGEHTDYTGGLSLPAAIDCWTVGAWRKRTDDQIHIYSANMSEEWRTSWSALGGNAERSWKKYVAGALALFRETKSDVTGFELAIVGNIPLGKGLSSSASVELALLNGLNLLFQGPLAPLDIAKLGQQIEHRYLHVKSGLLDQFACQFSKADGALLIDFETMQTRAAPIHSKFDRYRWVIVDSLVKRELSNSKYSERVEEYAEIRRTLEKAGRPSIRHLSPQEASGLFAASPANIQKRARHITSENERTLLACEALKSGDPQALGALLHRTHQSLARDYEVSHANLDFMVEIAQNWPGVMGGRMMGGGFGGCTLFLVEEVRTEEFKRKMADEYTRFSGLKTAPRTVRFVDGASAWEA